MWFNDITPTPGIYRIVNMYTGGFYVGSSVNLLQREQRHFRILRNGAHDNIHLQRAYDLYGPDAFRFGVLQHVEHEQVETLLSCEQHFIDTLNPTYNIARVAGNTLGVKATDAQKAKQRAAKLGKPLTPEHRAKMSESHLGKEFSDKHKENLRISQLGKTLPDATREKLRLVNLGKKQSSEHVAKRVANRATFEWSEERRAKVQATWEAKRLTKRQDNQPPLF